MSDIDPETLGERPQPDEDDLLDVPHEAERDDGSIPNSVAIDAYDELLAPDRVPTAWPSDP
jgi:hypothetical protein